MKKPSKKIVLPLLLLLAGAGIAFVVVTARPEVERTTPEAPAPLVEVLEVQPEDVDLDVYSQGTVTPHTESTLVAQVAGRIVGVSPDFAPGGFFRQGQVLIRIDPSDYHLAVSQAEAQVAQAKLRLEREQAEARVAREEWDDLGTGEPSALALRGPQLAEARAAVEGAEASLEQARLHLERTSIRAPYAGRVRAKLADVGQFVSPGTPLAEVFATDFAEVRLPIPKDQLAFLDLGLGANGTAAGPQVRLTGEIGGAPQTWLARVVRTGGEIDPQTRMLSVWARVDDPFQLRRSAGTVLPMGLFVEAEIDGRSAPGAVVVPRSALYQDDQVMVVADGRLDFRPVDVLRTERDRAVIGSGLAAGDQVVVSPVEAPVAGMSVRTRAAAPAAGAPEAAGATEERL